jgi:hypothetical protein
MYEQFLETMSRKGVTFDDSKFEAIEVEVLTALINFDTDSLEGRVGNITTMMKTLNKVQEDYGISYEQLSDLITRMHDYLINFKKGESKCLNNDFILETVLQKKRKITTVKLEEVELIFYESLDGSANKISSKVGVHPDDFDDFDALFDHWVDGKVYWWFTESEFKEASEQLFSSRDLFPLDNGVFIYEMTNNNEPIEITLEDA